MNAVICANDELVEEGWGTPDDSWLEMEEKEGKFCYVIVATGLGESKDRRIPPPLA